MKALWMAGWVTQYTRSLHKAHRKCVFWKKQRMDFEFFCIQISFKFNCSQTFWLLLYTILISNNKKPNGFVMCLLKKKESPKVAIERETWWNLKMKVEVLRTVAVFVLKLSCDFCLFPSSKIHSAPPVPIHIVLDGSVDSSFPPSTLYWTRKKPLLSNTLYFP